MMAKKSDQDDSKKDAQTEAREARMSARKPYMQNRELSWLEFNKRVLDQGADPSVPLLEQFQFVSIFWSNLQEFFMVRVGSLTDLALLKKEIIDPKSNMTPMEQLEAIYQRCHELYPVQERIYNDVEAKLAAASVRRWRYEELDDGQVQYVHDWLRANVLPFLQPQIINARHPFPHLESGALYIIVRLIDMPTKKKSDMTDEEKRLEKEEHKRLKNLGAEGVTLGIIPLPRQAARLIMLPGEGFNYILLEDALENAAGEVFSMYNVKHSNIICITRNADLDATEGADEREEDYREHMKKILKRRSRLAPVRLESRLKLSATVGEFLMTRLDLEEHQTFVTSVPLDLGYAFALPSMVDDEAREALTSAPFAPSWPADVKRNQSMIEQVQERELLFSYPYDSMDPFVQLLREAAIDPNVVSIKITLYRLASQSHLAEALITAAEAGKDVTALFELRARFDESNNIRWSQRFEEAGCNVIYGFHDYKVHSKICSITRSTPDGVQHITQLGTGNYNEKTAKLYTDFCFITTNPDIGHDAMVFFQNMGMESLSRAYQALRVAPLQIKQDILRRIDEQIERAQQGLPSGLFFKTNSITDKEIIEKLAEASQAGVSTTLLVRGISCLVPGVEGYTDNIRVVSIVGRLLEHSRIYGFGTHNDMQLLLSSADLMTRNMDKRVEIAWPVLGEDIRAKVIHHIDTCLSDTAKLRELRSDGTYTELGELAAPDQAESGILFNAQEALIAEAKQLSDEALERELSEKSAFEKLSMKANADRLAAAKERAAITDLEEIFREALQHEMPSADDEALKPFIKAVARTFAEVNATEAANETESSVLANETISAEAETVESEGEATGEPGVETADASDEETTVAPEVQPEAQEAPELKTNAFVPEVTTGPEAAEIDRAASETATEASSEPSAVSNRRAKTEPEAEAAPGETVAKPEAETTSVIEPVPETPTAEPAPKPASKGAPAASRDRRAQQTQPKKRGFFWRLLHRKKK